jgi:hypothetical protein
MTLKVAVSPFFGAESFYDELTGVLFERSKIGALAVYDLSNIDPSLLDNVRKGIRLNTLILMEGTLEPEVAKAAPVIEKVVAAPVTEEDAAEAVEPEVKKAPVAKKKA